MLIVPPQTDGASFSCNVFSPAGICWYTSELPNRCRYDDVDSRVRVYVNTVYVLTMVSCDISA